jgi:hypothetical protein
MIRKKSNPFTVFAVAAEHLEATGIKVDVGQLANLVREASVNVRRRRKRASIKAVAREAVALAYRARLRLVAPPAQG